MANDLHCPYCPKNPKRHSESVTAAFRLIIAVAAIIGDLAH